MSTFDYYLLRRYLHVFTIAFVSAYGLFVVIDGFTNIDAYQREAESTSEVLKMMGKYYVYQSSVFFNDVGQILSVVSVMAVFAMLYKHSEVQPILAAGIHTYRMILPFLIGTLVLEAGLTLNQELIFPKIGHHLLTRTTNHEEGEMVEPVYDYNSHIHIDGHRLFLGESRMENAQFVLPVPEISDELITIKAEKAIWIEGDETEPTGWHLYNTTPLYDDIPLTEKGRKTVLMQRAPDEMFIITDVGFDQLYQRNRSHKYVTTKALIKRIQNPAFGENSVRAQTLHLHQRLTRPIGSLLSVFIVVPLVIRKESPKLILNMAICASWLIIVYMSNQAFQFLGSATLVSPEMAAWGPLIFCGALGGWLYGVVLS